MEETPSSGFSCRNQPSALFFTCTSLGIFTKSSFHGGKGWLTSFRAEHVFNLTRGDVDIWILCPVGTLWRSRIRMLTHPICSLYSACSHTASVSATPSIWSIIDWVICPRCHSIESGRTVRQQKETDRSRTGGLGSMLWATLKYATAVLAPTRLTNRREAFKENMTSVQSV